VTGDAACRPSRAKCLAALLLAAGGLVQSLAFAQPSPASCGPLQALLFDYRTDQKQYKVVEEFHFTPEIEALLRGKSGTLGQELNYTLSNVPNHHRALISLTRYGEKMKSPQPPDLRYPIECYFERALRFKPDDNVARLLYANFLAHGQRTADATRQLEIAASNAGDNAFTHYNIGLIYFEMKVYDRALAQAHKAAALGFGRTALREQLQAAGKWREPTVATAAAAAASAAASASSTAPAPSTTAAEAGSSAASAASAAAN
jgi:tetratricopeptide (TPR) repeat protein